MTGFQPLFYHQQWFVIGEAGIGESTVIVIMSCCMTFITALSLSAIATNGKMKRGGSYYLVSRSLGPEAGGSVGVITLYYYFIY